MNVPCVPSSTEVVTVAGADVMVGGESRTVGLGGRGVAGTGAT